MPWFNIWDGLKSKICRYFLRRYLGQFLDDELNLEQLKLELCGGKATLCNVALKVEALNELLETQGWPFEFTRAHIDHLMVTVPWNALLTNDSSIEIGGITLCLRPVHRSFFGLCMLESMWSSASSSLQLAQECMKQADETDSVDDMTGNFICLDKFTETIDNVLNRITVQINNLRIILEYPLLRINENVNMVLEISLDTLQYKNKSGMGRIPVLDPDSGNEISSLNTLPAFITHNVTVKGINVTLNESTPDEDVSCDLTRNYKQLILQMKDEQSMEIIVKQCEEISGPKVNLNIDICKIKYFLAPHQINLMLNCFKRYRSSEGTTTSNVFPLKGKSHDLMSTTTRGSNLSKSEANFKHMDRSSYLESYCDAETDQFVSNFNIKITNLIGILLHEDVKYGQGPVAGSENYCSSNENYWSSENLRYFSKISTAFYEMTYPEIDYTFCGQNYLFFNLSPISIIGNQLRNESELRLQLSAAVAKLELFEVIEGQTVALFEFLDNETRTYPRGHDIPNLQLVYSSINNEYQKYSTLRCDELAITLGDNVMELDISMFDRLGAIIKEIELLLNDCSEEEGSENVSIRIHIECRRLHAKVRLPVMKCPTLQNSDSWKQRDLRSDYFLITCESFDLNVLKSKINAEMAQFTISYAENDASDSFKIATVRSEKDISSKSKRVWIQLETVDNLQGAFRGNNAHEIKPFSSRKSCQQRNTAGFIKTDYVDTEATVFPGEKDELSNFCSTALSASKLQFILNFPIFDIFLGSKKIYEIIYNRINTDILMWSPHSPYLQTKGTPNSDPEHVHTHHQSKKVQPNKCSITLNTNTAHLTLYTAKNTVRLDDKLILDNCGKFMIFAENLSVFLVTGYGGDDNLGYSCIQISNLEVNHSEDITNDVKMHRVVYKVPENLTKGPCGNTEQREMVTVAMEIHKESRQKIKRIKVSNGIKRMVLHYDQSTQAHVWITELLEFLDVVEYPVEGIEFYAAIIEMQMHFWDCAVDFRPKDFDYWALMEVVYFCITSNIISDVSGANMRFILEECVISIGPHIQENSLPAALGEATINSKDLVPVVDIGLFDISLRLNKISIANSPKLDFRCILNNVYMRTCYDSASALAQLIGHIAFDTQREDVLNKTRKETTNIGQTLNHVDGTDAKTENFNGSKATDVNVLLAEAVQDTSMESDQESFGNCSMDDILTENVNAMNMADFEALDTVSFESSYTSQEFNKDAFCEHIEQDDTHTEIDFISTFRNFESAEEHFKSDDDYCIIDENNINFDNIKLLNEPLRIVDNHFCIPAHTSDPLRSPENFPVAEQRYVLCEMTFTWHMYGGRDFSRTNASSTSKFGKKKFHTNMSATYRHGFACIEGSKDAKYTKKKEKTSWKTEGGPDRDHEVLVELNLSKLRLSYDIFPENSIYTSRKVLLVNEIEIKDRLQCSDINKLLYSPTIKNMSNRKSHHMLVLKALHVKSNPSSFNSQECSLRISLAPIRLHVDQATLEFLLNYFLDLKKEYESSEFEMMTSNCSTENIIKSPNESTESETTIEAGNESTSECSEITKKNANSTYFRELIFSPAVTICFDYHGRRVVLSKGPIAGLLMGLGQLQCSQIVLKKISHKRGILGIEKLVQFLCKEWLQDIKKHQLSKILSGIGPTYAFVQLCIHDLFWLPVEYYHRDGTVIRGLRIAAQSFSTRTIFAIIELTSRLIELLQFTAETTYDIVSADTSMAQRRRARGKSKIHMRRPKDLREGVVNAYELMKEGFNDSASNLIDMAKIQHDQHGVTGAVGAVLRQVPQLVVSPAVLATQATTNILGGVKNSLLPKSKIEEMEKWKEGNYGN